MSPIMTSCAAQTARELVQAGESAQAYSDLGVIAAQRAIAASGLSPDDIGAVISITETSDYLAPQAGALLAHRLGLRSQMVLNLNDGLVGFNQGIAAAGVLFTPEVEAVLLVTGEVFSSMGLESPSDVVGAYVVQAESQGMSIEAPEFRCFGDLAEAYMVKVGGSAHKLDHDALQRGEHCLRRYTSTPETVNEVRSSAVELVRARIAKYHRGERVGIVVADVFSMFESGDTEDPWQVLSSSDECAWLDKEAFLGGATLAGIFAGQQCVESADAVIVLEIGLGAQVSCSSLRRAV